MTTIYFGELRPRPGATEAGTARPIVPVSCSAIVVCHVAGRRRVTKP